MRLRTTTRKSSSSCSRSLLHEASIGPSPQTLTTAWIDGPELEFPPFPHLPVHTMRNYDAHIRCSAFRLCMHSHSPLETSARRVCAAHPQSPPFSSSFCDVPILEGAPIPSLLTAAAPPRRAGTSGPPCGPSQPQSPPCRLGSCLLGRAHLGVQRRTCVAPP